MSARRLAIAMAWIACACGDGTSAWILRAAEEMPGGAGGGARGGAGAAGAGRDGGVSSDAGAPAGGAGGQGAIERDPEAFAEACSPQIAFDNRTADENGALFDEAFPDPTRALSEISRRVCALLYKQPDEVPESSPIVLIIDDFYGIGEVGITAPVIYMRLSSLHMRSVAEAGEDVERAISGALHYMLAVHYTLDDENPAAVRWVTEGIAAFVRLRAGYASYDARRPGGSPDEDYETTGFFFDFLDQRYEDAVYRLNQSLDPHDRVRWSERVFEDITGKDLATLWREYQATL